MLHAPHMLLIKERVLLDQHLLGARLQYVLRRDPTEHALAQGFNDIAAFDERRHGNAVRGAAISLGDDQVLRHVHQAPGEVTRVRRFQRRVGETLAGAVG